jgi:hypothetical protein
MNSFRSTGLRDRDKQSGLSSRIGLKSAPARKYPAVTAGGALVLILISCLFCGRPGPPIVVIHTELGDITAKINTRKAPVTGSPLWIRESIKTLFSTGW